MFIIEQNEGKEIPFKDVFMKGAFLYKGKLYAKGGASEDTGSAYEFDSGSFVYFPNNEVLVTPVKARIIIEPFYSTSKDVVDDFRK
jgi:hypothetical protein